MWPNERQSGKENGGSEWKTQLATMRKANEGKIRNRKMNHRQITVRKGNFKREMAAAKISLWAHHNFFFTHFFSFISLPVTVPALLLCSVSVSVPISACVSLSASYVGSNNFCSFLSSFMGQRPTEL